MTRHEKENANTLPKSYASAKSKIEARFEHQEDFLGRIVRKVDNGLDRLEAKEGQVVHKVMAEFFRTLLIANCGDGVEGAIDTAIDDYKFFREQWLALKHMSSFDSLPEEIREHITACYESVLTQFDIILSRVGVSVQEVAFGTEVNRSLHHVVERLETTDVSQLDTVCRTLQPQFRWTIGNVERIRAAEVSAFTELTKAG